MAWYFWTDPEFCQGPFDSREEAIEAGRNEYENGESFEIAEGQPFKYQAPSFGMISDWFDDQNDEYSGEENPSEKWAQDHLAELERELTACFDAWLDRHGYRSAWALDLGLAETIPPLPVQEHDPA